MLNRKPKPPVFIFRKMMAGQIIAKGNTSMGKKKILKLMWLAPVVILISLTGGVSLYSQFLADEEEEKKPVEEKKVSDIAMNIKAEMVQEAEGSKCAIRVTWDLAPKMTGEYVVAASSEVIDTAEKVHKARVVQTVKGAEKNSILDPECTPGSHYYVVLSKAGITGNAIDLRAGSNFMTSPLVIGAEEQLPMVSNIRAIETQDLKVRLTWDRADKTALFYTVYRSRQVINTAERLKESEKLDTLVDISEYIDEGIATDVPYFYAVTVKALKGKDNMTLMPDRNYTTTGAMVTARKVEENKIRTIGASPEEGGVLVTWDFTGPGDANFRLFRSERQHRNGSEVASSEVLRTVNISDGSYRDAAVPPGRYFYGLLPGAGTDLSSHELVPGVNITRTAVVVRIKEEKKQKTERKKEKIETAEPDDIDRILKRTFFRSRYKEAIKELSDFIEAGADETAVAKGRLFIGRSHIELGRYRRSLDFLLLADVKKYFPKDADFWTAFALARIRNH